MKKEIKTERKVCIIGKPSIEKLSKSEQKAFYSTILSCIVEYYQGEPNENKDEKWYLCIDMILDWWYSIKKLKRCFYDKWE